MNDIPLANYDTDALENMFKVTKNFAMLGVTDFSRKKKLEKEIHLVTWAIKISQQEIQPQKVHIPRDQLQTLQDFQKLMGDISWLQSTIGLSKH